MFANALDFYRKSFNAFNELKNNGNCLSAHVVSGLFVQG